MSTTGYYEESYPPSLWEETEPPAPDKGSASPGDSFPNEPTVTAEDSANAAKLAPLGYVADPLTDWTVGQSITVNTFRFHWDATQWVAGVAPVVQEGETAATPAPSPERPPEGNVETSAAVFEAIPVENPPTETGEE